MKEKYDNSKEAICLILYSKPKNVREIIDALYGEGTPRNSRVSGWIAELLEMKWIEEKEISGDHRNKYYQTTPKALCDSICQEIDKISDIYKQPKAKLTLKEKEQLSVYLKGEQFRSFVNDILKNYYFQEKTLSFSYILELFSYRCIYTFTLGKHLTQKTGIDLSNSLIHAKLKNQILDYEKFFSDSDLLRLGYTLLNKIANTNRYRTLWLFAHFQFILKMCDTVNFDIIKKSLDKKTSFHA